MTTYIYELCGPLVDDATVTRDAYRHAAAMLGQIPPHLKDGYTDSQCGVDAITYNRRTAAYRSRACDARPGWALGHAHDMYFNNRVQRCQVGLFTSHSKDTLKILSEQPGMAWLMKINYIVGMDPHDRVWRLREWSVGKTHGQVVYVCAPWWHDYVTTVSGALAGVTYIQSAEALAWLDNKEIEND